MASAWAAPVILHVATSRAYASSEMLDALIFTSRSGSPQFGSNWGTAGEIQVQYSMENVLAKNPDLRQAEISVTLTLKGGPTTLVTTATSVAAGASYTDTTFRWIVPGYTPGQNHTFFFTMSAPGFATVTSGEFTVYLP
jgi:hypothetical protein